jgi:hypothetical protein
MSTQKPIILIVDDDPDDGLNLQRGVRKGAEVIIRTPDEFRKRDLQRADLVLVDHELDAWPGVNSGLTSPPNGLALSAVIRERINELRAGSVTAVALWSGKVDRIAEPLPSELRSFAFARLNNLEWVFAKDHPDVSTGVVSLAAAIQQLPRSWPAEPKGATRQLHKLLGLESESSFFPTAVDDIEACHPPIHELSEATHALTVIRWIAHRILPYPAFLVDRVGLAARLRLDLKDLDRLLRGGSKLARCLQEVEYRGALCDLYGKHWWRSGLDSLVFEWTGGTSEIDRLQAEIGRLAGSTLKFLDHEVVPGIGESYRPTELVRLSDAVRLRLDDWPPFADAAWAERELVTESDALKGLVLPLDSELLSPA